MKKNSERSAAMRFTMKLSILLTPFIALLVVYFLYRLANVYEQPGFHCI